MARIGYYVHHHGHGHRARATAILQHVRAETTVFTSATPPASLRRAADHIVRLPSDTGMPEGAGADVPVAAAGLHYAPIGLRGVTARMAELARWAAAAASSPLLVVDVSVEVALFGRLLGLPVVVVRQHGQRTDAPHRRAYEAAIGLLAPYPEALEDGSATKAVREKTFWCGGFSRFDDRAIPANDAEGESSPRTVTVFGGSGGTGWSSADLSAAARACPDWRWHVLGKIDEHARLSEESPVNLTLHGWVEDPYPLLVAADVIIASGGHNTVMEVAAAAHPLICFPEARPFDEQHHKARALVRLGAALAPGAWPAPTQWPRLLLRAAALDPAPLRRLCDGSGAQRAAAWLDDEAERFGTDAPSPARTA